MFEREGKKNRKEKKKTLGVSTLPSVPMGGDVNENRTFLKLDLLDDL